VLVRLAGLTRADDPDDARGVVDAGSDRVRSRGGRECERADAGGARQCECCASLHTNLNRSLDAHLLLPRRCRKENRGPAIERSVFDHPSAPGIG